MHMIRLMTACLVLTADAQKLTEKEVMDLSLSGPTRRLQGAAAGPVVQSLEARRLQATQAPVGKDGKPITLTSILNKVIGIVPLLFGGGKDKLGTIMKELMKEVFPDVMKMLDSADPDAIKDAINTVLGDPEFEKAVEKVLGEPGVKTAATKIFDSLLASPALKDIAEKACKVVSGEATLASLVGRRLQGRKLYFARTLKGLFETDEQNALFDKIVKQLTPIGAKFIFGGKDNKNKVQEALKEVLKILPDAIQLVELIDPQLITDAVEGFFEDETFINTIKDFLKEHAATAKKVVGALLEVEPIKKQAVDVCKVVTGETTSAELLNNGLSIIASPGQ